MKNIKPLSLRISCIFLLFLFFHSQTYSQERALKSISKNDLESHLKFISNDFLKGRKLGSPELNIASQYLASNLKKMNLKAFKENKSYFQYIDFLSVIPDNKSSFLKIRNKNSEIILSGDSIFNLFPHPKNAVYNGQVIFAGYGITDSVNGYNDYENIDVKNKIVLIMSRTPELAIKNDSLDNEPFLYHTEYDKIHNAHKNGAKAVLWVSDPLNPHNKISDLKELDKYAKQSIYPKHDLTTSFPLEFTIISPHTANLIMASSGKNLAEIQSNINKKMTPASFEITNCEISYSIKRKFRNFKSPNVIGYIEGTDSTLKKEHIIYTAHYDHLGIDEEGNVFNGADDNGSGTVALLELAEAYMHLPQKPKRTIVFAWMTAEEKGGIGSSYYVGNAIFPIENTVCCINLDCIGRIKTSISQKAWVDVKSKDSLFVITGNKSSRLLSVNNRKCQKLKLLPDYSDKYRLKYSDQYFFHKKGIPVLFYHTGFHEDYHSIGDEIEKIDFDKMTRITQLAFLVGLEIANKNERLKIDNPQ